MPRCHTLIWRIIGRGLAGWHASGVEEGNRVSSSGGSLEGYVAEALDGTPIYDAEDADAGAFVHFTMAGPMDDVTLPQGKVKLFKERAKLAAMLPALGGGFQTIGMMGLAREPGEGKYEGLGSIDSVATDVWLQMLRRHVPGVRFGHVDGGRVLWEEVRSLRTTRRFER
jgi:hypothetical protein